VKYKKILLTGGSGKLGQAIASSGYFGLLLAPSRKELDITKFSTVERFFNKHSIDAVVHCAALARMAECEEDPVKAISANIIGTSNLVMAVLSEEKKSKEKNKGKELQKKIRFIHISTDGVYAGTKGNYSEKDAAIPYNKYGWTKLGAECPVNLLSDFCIIRTSFFDPKNIKFEESAVDAYSSKMPINELVKAIHIMLESGFIGTINIGADKRSDYERYKGFKPSLKPCRLKDILNKVPFNMAYDASLNTKLWIDFQSNRKQAKNNNKI